MDKIIICPNNLKMEILDDFNKEETLHSIKFMTKKEFFDNYYFKTSNKTLEYIINKYKYDLDVCKVYLNNLYVIDINKTYKSKKLEFLKELKQELIDNNLLEFNPLFKEFIKDKEIEVINYYDLDKYEEEVLNYKVNHEVKEFKHDVYEFDTLEDEVNYVCLEIIKLLNNNIDINNIYLTNVTDEYIYTIKKLFKYYNIPINLKERNTIYATKVVKDYLETKTIDIDNRNKSIINKKLVSVLSSLSDIDEDTCTYKILLKDKLKHTYLPNKRLKNAINIKDFYNDRFNDNEYVFVLGFNQDALPKMNKDIEFINDSIKDEVSLYKTNYLNKRNKSNVMYILSNIKNLYLSYKLSSPFSSFYKSSLINDYNLNVVKYDLDVYNYSNIYNKLKLGEKLDLYNLYGEIDSSLVKLLTHYNIPYKSYKNDFTGINKDIYKDKLPKPLQLSYTSLNSYSECKFKYYLNYVLKLNKYEETFSQYIGTMYHDILTLYRNKDFSLEEEYNKYIKDKDFTLKEKMLLLRVKEELKDFIEIIKKQDLITGYNNNYYEKEIKIDINTNLVFKGIIDKIMYYENIEDTYFSIVDYKSGLIDTHIEPMKYGLHMQLPVYLYLIHNSNVFKNPIFTGIYYQNILFNYPTYSTKLEKEIKERTFLQGYSTDDDSVLARFDPTFEKSELIKSMSYKEDKGFGTYAKVVDKDTLNNLVDYTKDYIETTGNNILEGDFEINPKSYDGKNISCEFCKFKDICFMKEKDLKYLDKVEDLSFLGGEE